jgi:cell wall-associated NlpC family hydrolase
MAAVQARIAELQSRFPVAGLAVVRSAPTGAAAAPASATAFSAALADASQPGMAGGAVAGPAATAGTAPGVTGSDVTGADVVTSARKFLGVPYAWGGTNPATGLDCSGMIQRAYADLGIELPRVSRDQAKAGRPVASLEQARPGDLVAFGRPVDHIGIYIGDGKMIAAPRRGDVVKIQDVYRTPTAIRRILPEPGAVDTAGGTGTTAAVSSAPAARSAEATYAPLFASAGARHGVSPALLTAVARAESGFNPGARSPAGAQGLMQLMPATARGLGVDPWKPEQAVDGAARLLKQHLDRFGSTELALAAYNAGPGAVSKHGGIPPYAETQNYVRKIMNELRAEAA